MAQVERGPFDDAFFATSGPEAQSPLEIEVPMGSIEIPIPPGIADSLPQLDSRRTVASIATPLAPERRTPEALIKEVSIPLNLSMSELREHRRLRLKITLDVNLLP